MKTHGPYAFTKEEMKSAKRSHLVQALGSTPTIWQNGRVKIVRIADNAVVKYGMVMTLNLEKLGL
jgi:hypothetical protein